MGEKVNMNESIREKMEGWARWRHYRHGAGYGKTLLQRCRDGIKGTNCPTCRGGGTVPGTVYGLGAAQVACQTCNGRGYVKLDANDRSVSHQPCPHCEIIVKSGTRPYRESTGEINGRTCFHCRGSGVLTQVIDLANPATIRSTYREPDSPVYQRIDRLVCELRQRDELLGYWFVVHQEYCDHRGGTQEKKSLRLGIGIACYQKRLQRAIEWIDAALADPRDVREIPFPWRH
jgi:hypothetical protein